MEGLELEQGVRKKDHVDSALCWRQYSSRCGNSAPPGEGALGPRYVGPSPARDGQIHSRPPPMPTAPEDPLCWVAGEPRADGEGFPKWGVVDLSLVSTPGSTS